MASKCMKKRIKNETKRKLTDEEKRARQREGTS